MTSRHPKTTDGLTHGWRWYRVVDDRLMSPLAPGTVMLPRDGVLERAFFIPRAQEMFWMAFQIRHEKWYDFALTFGAVHGPFAYDHSMPRIGSMQSTRYESLTILSTRPADIQKHYDIPVIDGGDYRKSILTAAELVHTCIS